MAGPDVGYRGDATTHLVGVLSLIASIIVYAMALEALRREGRKLAQADATRVWWFGYLRDLMNLLALVLLALSHYLLGFEGPVALMTGFATGFTLYLLDSALAHFARLTRAFPALVAIIVLLTLPTQIAPRSVARVLGGVLHALFS
jgi:hypothetical protein